MSYSQQYRMFLSTHSLIYEKIFTFETQKKMFVRFFPHNITSHNVTKSPKKHSGIKRDKRRVEPSFKTDFSIIFSSFLKFFPPFFSRPFFFNNNAFYRKLSIFTAYLNSFSIFSFTFSFVRQNTNYLKNTQRSNSFKYQRIVKISHNQNSCFNSITFFTTRDLKEIQ